MSLSAFFNPVEVENKKVVVSKRFVENGEPVEWELKAISAEQDDKIRKTCIIKPRNNKEQRGIDEILYLSKLTAACVVYPDLQNAELQDHYHTAGAENLLKEMLTFSEYNFLASEVLKMNDVDKSLDDMVDEVKN